MAELSLAEKVRDFLNEKYRPHKPYKVGSMKLHDRKWEVFSESVKRISIWEDNQGKIHLVSNIAHRPRDVLFWMNDHVVVGSRKPKSKEDAEKMHEERSKVINEVFECIEKKKWDERFKFKSRSIRRLIAEMMWGDEIARIVGCRLGVEVAFKGSRKSFFESVFDSAGMSEEQILREIAERYEALEEAYLRYEASLEWNRREHREFKEFYRKMFGEK